MAGIWSFASVNSSVYFELAVFRKGLSTDRASKWLFHTMLPSPVSHKVNFYTERFPAVRAGKWLFFSVNFLVF